MRVASHERPGVPCMQGCVLTQSACSQTRSGLFQGVVGNLPAVWGVRAHPRVCDAFKHMYLNTREWVGDASELGQLVTSVDGVNIKPPTEPFAEPASAEQDAKYGPGGVDMESDWAHVDQLGGKWWNTFQGQVRTGCRSAVAAAVPPSTARAAPHRSTTRLTVLCHCGHVLQVLLTNTSAGFVCSPRSHLIVDQVLAANGCSKVTGRSGFNRLRNQAVYAKVAGMVRELGGHFQVPVCAPAGSLVLWSSTTLHSARLHVRPATPSAARAAASVQWDLSFASVDVEPGTPSKGRKKGKGRKKDKHRQAARPAEVTTPATPAAAVTAATVASEGAGTGAGTGAGAGAGAGEVAAAASEAPTGAGVGHDDWRVVVYVCHRPLRDVGDAEQQGQHLRRAQRCWKENRNTNHAGERLFGKGLRGNKFIVHGSASSGAMARLVEEPARVYSQAGLRPRLTSSVAGLLGLPHNGDHAA